MFEVPEGTLCACGQKATRSWTCCSMCMNHGLYEFRCELCCLDEQIAHAAKQAERLPDLWAEREARKAGKACVCPDAQDRFYVEECAYHGHKVSA